MRLSPTDGYEAAKMIGDRTRLAYRSGYNKESRFPRRLLLNSLDTIHRLGGARFVQSLVQELVAYALYVPTHQGMTFRVGERAIPYLQWPTHTERAIEIPFALRRARDYLSGGGRCLEVGNVLNHWSPFSHDVLDKYEQAAGVINEDVTQFRPTSRYDLVVSVSTLEHVGYDEEVRTPGKVLVAARSLYDKCLVDGGHMVVTFPLGYNPSADRLIVTDPFSRGQVSVLRRQSSLNLWQEIACPDPENLDPTLLYDRGLFVGANAVALCDVAKTSREDDR